MSSTIGTIAGTTGLGSERQVVWASISGLWWAFQLTGTNVLSSWHSPDGGTWTAGATHTLAAAHGSEGRDLMVTCKTIGGIDTVAICYIITPTTTHTVKALRATISGTTITYHTTDTTISDASATGGLANPSYSGGGWEFSSDNRVACVNGALDVNQDISFTHASADPGTAEQATAPTWSSVQGLDSSMAKEVKSGFLADIGSTHLVLLSDDGSGDSTCTGFKSETYDGATWSSLSDPVSGITAIDKNDWGAVARTTSDIHLVYRTATGSLVHLRFDGTSWSTGQTIPTQANLAGGGLGLCSDGISVWLAVIDTDASNTIRYIQWTPDAYTGHGDAWADAWSALESFSATRSMLGMAPTTDGAFNLLAYWTEGSSMVAATAAAPYPPDPPGLANEDAISALGTLSGAVLTIIFTGSQPHVPGQVRIGFVASWPSSAPSISSVHDNAAVQNTGVAVAGATNIGSTQGEWIYYIDIPAGATWSGNYTITITFSAAPAEAGGGAIAYDSMATGAPTATNNATGSGSPAAPGSVTPPAAPATYFALITDNTGANPDTFTWPAPFLKKITETNGSTGQAYSIGTALNNSGTRNPSVTIDSALWNAGIAVWPGAPVSADVYREPMPRLSGLRVG